MRRNRRDPLTGGSRRRLKALAAALILLVALAVRVGYVAGVPYHAINDAGTYNRMASMIATYGDYHVGDGPRSGAGNSRGPTAYFPPAFPYYLAVADLVDGHRSGGRAAVGPERIEMAVTGTISVALLGLLALEVFGEGVALIAMILAALYPVFLETSGILAAENLVVALELGAAWMALRTRRARPGARTYLWIAATGLVTGLAALAHENAILYVIPFAIAAWLTVRSRIQAPRRGLRALAGPVVLVAATCAMIAPWTIRNAVMLHTFVPISDETGITLAGTYNPTSAHDPRLPYKWHLFSHVRTLHYLAHRALTETEPQLSAQLTTKALAYIKAHPLAPVIAGLDNTLRMFELEGTFAWGASTAALGIREPWATIGVYAFYVLCLAAIAGLFTRRVRRAPWWLWLMPILWWVSIVPVNVETPRFREPIDPFFILLAACALATAARRLGLGGSPVRRRRRAAELTSDQAELVQMV